MSGAAGPPSIPVDGTKDGSGYWLDGRWYTVANYNARMVRRRLEAGFSHQDAYRDLEAAPLGDVADVEARMSAPPPLITPMCDPELPVNPMWRTHHEAGSAEERYSRTMRFDKYYAMQQLLMVIADREDETQWAQIIEQAKEILAGMVRPRGPAVRAKDRATELDMLALAYRVASGVFPVESPHLAEARSLMVEALKAWERAHPPAPIDPLLTYS